MVTLKYFLNLVLLFVLFNPATLQAQNAKPNIKADSTLKRKGFVDRMQDLAVQSAQTSAGDLAADKAATVQMRVFNEVRLTLQDAKAYLRSGLDTSALSKKLMVIKTDFITASQGVFVNQGSIQTYRNLSATKKIINELLFNAKASRQLLNVSQKEYSGYRYRLDSLLNAKEMFAFPKDSVELLNYLQNLSALASENTPIDSALKAADLKTQKLLNVFNLTINQLEISREEIDRMEEKLAENTFDAELPNIWQSARHFVPFKEILEFSMVKSFLTFRFYLMNNLGKVIILLILVLTAFIYLSSLKKLYADKNLLSDDYQQQLIFRSPILSASVIILSLFQFIFISPPFIFNAVLWLICCVCLTFAFRGFITRYWMLVWLMIVGFFSLAVADNFILQASRIERWYIFIFTLSGALSGLAVLIQRRENELRERWITYSIALMILFELISFILNIYGRYNLAKTLYFVGYLNVVISIIFLWTVRLINEGLVLAFNIYTVQDRKLFYLNFGRVGNRAPALLYAFLVLGWIILIGRNFPLFEYFSKPLLNFLSASRTIGDYSFSINSLFLFFAIMSISVIVSKLVSYFTSDDHLISKTESGKKKGLGSWVLLVRIFILSLGLFLSVAAAGIPVDRITIIIGALGVGIGFGLQAVVNNLVSGLIIAFEKPVNVGDIVDIDGQGGTMKSIGFRSSVISTWDGGDLVMPNGDLLNSHLVNWTLAGNRKRTSLKIAISYDANLEQCRMVVTSLLEKDNRILKNPKPALQFEQFGSSAIELAIYFWTRNLGENGSAKSDLIESINLAFKEQEIKIPVSQHEVYIHQIAGKHDISNKKN